MQASKPQFQGRREYASPLCSCMRMFPFKFRRGWRPLLSLGLVMFLLALALVTGVDMTAHALAQAKPGLTVVQSNAKQLTLELNLPELNIEPSELGGGTYSDVSIPEWGYINQPGKPRLPILGTLVGIPQGAQVRIRVLEDQ